MLKKSFSIFFQLQKKEQNNRHNREQTKAGAHEIEACKMFRIHCPLPPSECNISRIISFAVFESSCESIQWKCLCGKPLITEKQQIYHDASKVFVSVLCLSELSAFRSSCLNRRLLKVSRHCAEEKVFLCKGHQRAIEKVLTACSWVAHMM